MLSIYRASEAGHLTLQTITLPPGLSDGAIYTLPPDNRGRYLRLDLEIVVVAEQEPEPEPEPQQPRRPAPEAEADEEPWHWPWIAAAALAVVVVLEAGTFGWSQFRGDDASALDAAGQGQGESELPAIIPPPSTTTPTLTPSASPSPSPTPLEPGDGTPLVDEVVATKNVVRGFSPGVYVPQLGAHCSQLESADLYREGGGYGADGTPEAYPSGLTDQDILGFHRQVGVHLALPVALIQDASPTNCGTDTLWVSLANEQRATAAEIQAWCEHWAFPEGECIPRQVSGEMVEQARWVPYTLLSDSNDVTIEVPWTMAAVQDDWTFFIDRDAPALLTHQLFTDPQQAPTVTSSVDFLRDGGGEPWVDDTMDGGYAVSGVNSRGDVYYRRAYPRPGGTTVLTWWYPESAKATWNPAVDHVSDTFVPAG